MLLLVQVVVETTTVVFHDAVLPRTARNCSEVHGARVALLFPLI